MMQGYDIELLKLLSKNLKMPVVACGGAGNINHLKEGLKEGEAHAVVSLIYVCLSRRS